MKRVGNKTTTRYSIFVQNWNEYAAALPYNEHNAVGQRLTFPGETKIVHVFLF